MVACGVNVPQLVGVMAATACEDWSACMSDFASVSGEGSLAAGIAELANT